MGKVLVFGRKKPNNDSIMSALVFAQMRNQLEDADEYVAMRLGDLPYETDKMFRAWGVPQLPLLDRIPLPLPGEERVRVALTDHNEASQSVEGIGYARVMTVIDHHRVAGFRSFEPMEFIALPWGATCSIVAHLFDAYGLQPTEIQAACLLSAIMTDTVLLKSPSTTIADVTYAERLSKHLHVDPLEFGRQVFRFRRTEAYTPEQMVGSDVKRFDVGGRSVLIAKYETVNKDYALNRLPELRSAMDELRERERADTLVQCVVDVTNEGAQLLACGDMALVQEGLGRRVPEGGVWMDGVLSRKVQIAPRILAAAELLR